MYVDTVRINGEIAEERLAAALSDGCSTLRLVASDWARVPAGAAAAIAPATPLFSSSRLLDLKSGSRMLFSPR
jgi:hypothetical protein